MKTVRLRVRELAEARGWNISQLQLRAGLSMGAARRYWYSETSAVDLRVLAQIAESLGVAPSELLGDIVEERAQ